MLIWFPNHGFSKECQIQIFLDGLSAIMRHWVERGNGTAFFSQLSVDEAYCLLEDMANFDNWSCNSSMNNQDWGNSSHISEPWYDTRPHHAESSPELQALVAQFSKETKHHIEKLERMEVLH